MSLRRKIFSAFVLILMVSTGIGFAWIYHENRNAYAFVVEDQLAEIAYLFATQIEQEWQRNPTSSLESWTNTYSRFKSLKFDAQILQHRKQHPALDVYITNAQGIVLYSSSDLIAVGKDFSNWRDIAAALKGHYGARSTRFRDSKLDNQQAAYYVAAPILKDGHIEGTVSIFKKRKSITELLNLSLAKVALAAVLVFIFAVIFGGLLLFWITKPIDEIIFYAREVSEGAKGTLPRLPHRELQQLLMAFEEMRIAVEGRKTIERFVQSLTHELKSPLTAVRASAEILQEPIADGPKQRFVTNILEEVDRAQRVMEELLTVAALEAQSELQTTTKVSLLTILTEVKQALIGICQQGNILISIDKPNEDIAVEGDEFLLTQVFRNLLQNAVEFSDTDGVIDVKINRLTEKIEILITDHGDGIPAFAQTRLYEKFFSTARPRTGKKGTGLGLCFVREVVHLHQGEVLILSPVPNQKRGTQVQVTFPASL